ncbi:MAG: hypothetical protein ACXW05_06250 [Gemmatirosa sp.]
MTRIGRASLGSLLAALTVAGCAGAVASPGAPGALAASVESVATAGLAIDWTAATCVAPAGDTARDTARDADADRLRDDCELALARAFAPELRVDPRDCLWTTADAPARLAGGYLFAARPTTSGVRLAYLPAYARDCGWDGIQCLKPGGCGAHAGDSELILVDVAPSTDGQRWRTDGVFLSAHCGGRSAGRCRWFRGDDLARLTWADARPLGAPRIWVALGKHGHYPSRTDCDRGHWGYDSCDRADAAYRVPIVSGTQNVGGAERPLPAPDGCRVAADLPFVLAGAHPAARECLWDADRPFRGWQPDSAGAGPTSYGRALREIGGF